MHATGVPDQRLALNVKMENDTLTAENVPLVLRYYGECLVSLRIMPPVLENTQFETLPAGYAIIA